MKHRCQLEMLSELCARNQISEDFTGASRFLAKAHIVRVTVVPFFTKSASLALALLFWYWLGFD